MNSILNYFPEEIKTTLQNEKFDFNNLEEIRLRVLKPIILKFHDQEKIIKHDVKPDEIISTLQSICENSIYSYQEEIAQGFITLKGGHRVGITGSCVIENGKVININYINSLNFRIVHQIYGAGYEIIKLMINKQTIFNTLIIAPPGSGKTTILRDIIRQLSSGIKSIKFLGITCGLVDERSEIASLYKGVPQNDVGIKTDVIDNVSKEIGIKMLVRSMAPQVIAADEIGSKEDLDSLNYAMCSGCKGVFTAHGESFDDIYKNNVLNDLVKSNIFDLLVFLDSSSKGKMKEAYKFNIKTNQYEKIEEDTLLPKLATFGVNKEGEDFCI